MNRRQLIKGIGAAICAGAVPPFVPWLVGGNDRFDDLLKALYAPALLEAFPPTVPLASTIAGRLETISILSEVQLLPGLSLDL